MPRATSFPLGPGVRISRRGRASVDQSPKRQRDLQLPALRPAGSSRAPRGLRYRGRHKLAATAQAFPGAAHAQTGTAAGAVSALARKAEPTAGHVFAETAPPPTAPIPLLPPQRAKHRRSFAAKELYCCGGRTSSAKGEGGAKGARSESTSASCRARRCGPLSAGPSRCTRSQGVPRRSL